MASCGSRRRRRRNRDGGTETEDTEGTGGTGRASTRRHGGTETHGEEAAPDGCPPAGLRPATRAPRRGRIQTSPPFHLACIRPRRGTPAARSAAADSGRAALRFSPLLRVSVCNIVPFPPSASKPPSLILRAPAPL